MFHCEGSSTTHSAPELHASLFSSIPSLTSLSILIEEHFYLPSAWVCVCVLPVIAARLYPGGECGHEHLTPTPNGSSAETPSGNWPAAAGHTGTGPRTPGYHAGAVTVHLPTPGKRLKVCSPKSAYLYTFEQTTGHDGWPEEKWYLQEMDQKWTYRTALILQSQVDALLRMTKLWL